MWYIIMSCFETLVSPIFFTYPIGLRAPGRTPEHTWTDIDITAGQGRPSAMDASTNYYLLLGIFDPDDDLSGTSDADPEVMESIRHAISDKQLESGRASRNPRKAIQLEGKRRLDLLQHAETALDTQAKRERQFDEALAIVDTAMAKHVGNFASKGFIAAPEIGLIVDRIADETGYAPTPITVRSFARRKHIDIRRTAAPSDALKPIEPPKPDSFHDYEAIRPHLDVCGVDDLYIPRRQPADLLVQVGVRAARRRPRTVRGDAAQARYADRGAHEAVPLLYRQDVRQRTFEVGL